MGPRQPSTSTAPSRVVSRPGTTTRWARPRAGPRPSGARRALVAPRSSRPRTSWTTRTASPSRREARWSPPPTSPRRRPARRAAAAAAPSPRAHRRARGPTARTGGWPSSCACRRDPTLLGTACSGRWAGARGLEPAPGSSGGGRVAQPSPALPPAVGAAARCTARRAARRLALTLAATPAASSATRRAARRAARRRPPRARRAPSSTSGMSSRPTPSGWATSRTAPRPSSRRPRCAPGRLAAARRERSARLRGSRTASSRMSLGAAGTCSSSIRAWAGRRTRRRSRAGRRRERWLRALAGNVAEARAAMRARRAMRDSEVSPRR